MADGALVLSKKQDSGNTASITTPFLTDIAVGKLVVVGWNGPQATTITSFTPSDTAGNTYTKVPELENDAPAIYQQQLAWTIVTDAIDSATDTFTVAATGANPAKWAVIGASFDTLILGADVHHKNSGSSAAPSTGATGLPAQSKQLLISLFGYSDADTATTFTKPSGSTLVAKLTASPGSTARSLAMCWQLINTSAARQHVAGLGVGEGWGGIIAAFNQRLTAITPLWWQNSSGVWLPYELVQL